VKGERPPLAVRARGVCSRAYGAGGAEVSPVLRPPLSSRPLINIGAEGEGTLASIAAP
jgi:hypothetical protein